MTDRLSPLDVSLLHRETPTTAMHVGSVATLEPPEGGFDYERLVELIAARIALVPRYRQRLRFVPSPIVNPVWVDDEHFDISYHVRRSALPKPGTEGQLRQLVGRLMTRQLDRSRPLWEIYLVEGLAGGRVGVVTKTHVAVVDGSSAVDIATVLFDHTPTPNELPPDDWRPGKEPGLPALVAGAVADLAARPARAVSAARASVGEARQVAGTAAGLAGGLLSSVRSITRAAPDTPLNTEIGVQRRFGMARTELDDYKRVRKAHGGTVNDVVLATVAGALRTWLLTRGEAVTPSTVVRAMVPVSVRTEGQEVPLSNHVSSYVADLPVGESNPVMRLHQVSFAMRGHKESGQYVGPDALLGLAGFAPPTLHALGARVAASSSRRLFNLVVTNVPGPQFPMYAAGARMLEMYPVIPLGKSSAVSIGLTSYNGGVYYGLNADWDAMSDIDVLANCLEESLEELVGTVS